MSKSAIVRSLLLDVERPAAEIARIADVHRSEVYRISAAMRRPVGQLSRVKADVLILGGEVSRLESKVSRQDLVLNELTDKVFTLVSRLDQIESHRS